MTEQNGNEPKPLQFTERSDQPTLMFPSGFALAKGFADGNLYRLDRVDEFKWELVPTTLEVEQSRARLAAAVPEAGFLPKPRTSSTAPPDWRP